MRTLLEREHGWDVQSVAGAVAPALHAAVVKADAAAVVPAERELVELDVARRARDSGAHAPAHHGLVGLETITIAVKNSIHSLIMPSMSYDYANLDSARAKATRAHELVLLASRWIALPAMVVAPALDVVVRGDAASELPRRGRDLLELRV